MELRDTTQPDTWHKAEVVRKHEDGSYDVRLLDFMPRREEFRVPSSRLWWPQTVRAATQTAQISIQPLMPAPIALDLEPADPDVIFSSWMGWEVNNGENYGL